MKKHILILAFIIIAGKANAQNQDSLSVALALIDLHFSQAELDSMKTNVSTEKMRYRAIRKMSIPNDMPYSMVFMPPINQEVLDQEQLTIDWGFSKKVKLPKDLNELAFYPVHDLSVLIKNQQISSLDLTKIFIERLKKYGDTLECVISITESRALEQAKKADEELSNGIYRGPLHGIPYGAKDLLAAKGYKTTWGAEPYKDQVLDYDATVIKKLEDAGAVLVAKLTLGALAWGDVWYGGKTRNPWDLTRGSSGSSAGSASATVAGLVPFAIGSETWGSIVSPSTECGATGLRPTFGRVSKSGAMALSWSMDKLGPICRNALDCAMVFEAIRGSDGKDLGVRDFPFNYQTTRRTKNLRIGILNEEFSAGGFNSKNDSLLIERLKKEGFELVEKSLPNAINANALSFILSAEAGAAFDDLTRSGRDSLMARQIKNAWPNVFRSSRLIPAAEYIQANRLRYQLTMQFNEMIKDVDVLIAPSFSRQLLITNLTGHPCVVLPNGSYAQNQPGTISLLGNHFDEASILEFAQYIQSISDFEDEHPSMFIE